MRTIGNTAQVLPPKMAAQFAQLAKDGKADNQTSSTYVFYRGNQEICLVTLNPPSGYVAKRSK